MGSRATRAGKKSRTQGESANGERVIWLLKNGVQTTSINLPTLSPNWHIAGVGDILDNGQSDLVFENTATGQHTIWILKEGVFQSSITLPVVSGPHGILSELETSTVTDTRTWFGKIPLTENG
jgi:hypothetical protein